MPAKEIKVIVENSDLLKPDNKLFNENGLVEDTIANTAMAANQDGFLGAQPSSIKVSIIPESILAIDYLPSLGGTQGKGRTQLAFRDQFVAVVGSAYHSIDLSEPDLIKLAMLSAGTHLLIDEIDRALNTYDKWDPVNAAFGKQLVTVLGFSWESIANEKQSWIDARNNLADIVRTKFYLGSFKALDVWHSLASKIFTTDTDRKTQLVVFRPLEYTTIINFVDCEIMISDANTPKANGSYTKLWTLSKLREVATRLNNFSLSAWYNEVAPYLHHLYGGSDSSLYRIAESYSVENWGFTYSEEVNTMIRNARFTGKAKPVGSLNYDPFAIWETESGYIAQGGYDPISGQTPDFPGYQVTRLAAYKEYSESGFTYKDAYLFEMSDKLNLPYYPANSKHICAALSARFHVNFVSAGSPSDRKVGYVVDFATPITFTGAQLYRPQPLNPDDPNDTVNYTIDDFYQYILLGSGAYCEGGSLTRMIELSTPSIVRNEMFQEVRKLNFAVLPPVFYFTNDFSNTNDELAVEQYNGDWDNVVLLPSDLRYSFYNAINYENYTFAVPPAPKR